MLLKELWASCKSFNVGILGNVCESRGPTKAFADRSNSSITENELNFDIVVIVRRFPRSLSVRSWASFVNVFGPILLIKLLLRSRNDKL